MGELRLEGRLGVEAVCPVKGCCVNTVLSWRPQMIGQKTKCMFCDNPLKTIRATDTEQPNWSGMLNETKIERGEPELGASDLWFSRKKFASEDAVRVWCDERGMSDVKVDSFDGDAYRVVLGKSMPETERLVWAAPGVLASIGVMKIDTGSMATGGMLHPLQQGGQVVEDPTKGNKKEETTETEAKSNGSVHDAVLNFEKSLDAIFVK